MHTLTLTLIRGIPGAGKSHIASALLLADPSLAHFENDQFFIDPKSGTYNYNKENIKLAVEVCLTNTRAALSNGISTIVSNTFTQQWELTPYVELARRYNATLQIIEVWSNHTDIHEVPQSTIERMRERFTPTTTLWRTYNG